MHLKNNTEHSANTDKIKQYKNGVNCIKKKKRQNKTVINIKFRTVATVSREGTSKGIVALSVLCSWAGC